MIKFMIIHIGHVSRGLAMPHPKEWGSSAPKFLGPILMTTQFDLELQILTR